MAVQTNDDSRSLSLNTSKEVLWPY